MSRQVARPGNDRMPALFFPAEYDSDLKGPPLVLRHL